MREEEIRGGRIIQSDREKEESYKLIERANDCFYLPPWACVFSVFFITMLFTNFPFCIHGNPIVADSDAGGKGKGKKKAAATGPAKCKLPESVQAFVERISDAKMMTSQLESMKIDTKKMPLGKLNRKVILQGTVPPASVKAIYVD